MKPLLTTIIIIASTMIMLGGCSTSDKESSLDREYSGSKASADSAETDPSETKLVKTADIKFKVTDAARAGRKISAIAKELGGMVMHHQLESELTNSQELRESNDSILLVSSYRTEADMTVRIPAAYMEDFMDAVAGMSVFVDHRNMDIEDKTLDYLSAQLKSANRTEYIKQQESNTLKSKDAEKVLAIKDDKVANRISNLQTDAQVKYSTVTLNFYQNNAVSRERMANTDLTNYRVPFTTSFATALSKGWYAFEAVLIFISHLWAFILLGAAAWLAVKLHQKHKTGKPQPNLIA